MNPRAGFKKVFRDHSANAGAACCDQGRKPPNRQPRLGHRLGGLDLGSRRGQGRLDRSVSTALRVYAEHKLGLMLRETDRNEGGHASLYAGSKQEPAYRVATLAELGLDKKLSFRSQATAELPVDSSATVSICKIYELSNCTTQRTN